MELARFEADEKLRRLYDKKEIQPKLSKDQFKQRVDRSIIKPLYMSDDKELKKLCKFSPKVNDLSPFINQNLVNELVLCNRQLHDRRTELEAAQTKYYNQLFIDEDSDMEL